MREYNEINSDSEYRILCLFTWSLFAETKLGPDGIRALSSNNILKPG